MIESDIFKIEAAEHHPEQHGASVNDTHAGDISPHGPEAGHITDAHSHGEVKAEEEKERTQ